MTENPPIPQGSWGLHGIGDRIEGKGTRTPEGKKVQKNRRRERQAKASRKINRR